MNSYEDIINWADRLLSDARATHRLIHEPRFRDAWARADDKQKKEVISAIDRLASGGVSRWIQIVNSAIVEEMSLRELRLLGKSYGIPYYNRRNKPELIKRINIARQNIETERQKAVHGDADSEALNGVSVQSERSLRGSENNPLGPGSALLRDAGSRTGKRGHPRSRPTY